MKLLRILEVDDQPANELFRWTGDEQLVVRRGTGHLLAKQAPDVDEHGPIATLDGGERQGLPDPKSEPPVETGRHSSGVRIENREGGVDPIQDEDLRGGFRNLGLDRCCHVMKPFGSCSERANGPW